MTCRRTCTAVSPVVAIVAMPEPASNPPSDDARPATPSPKTPVNRARRTWRRGRTRERSLTLAECSLRPAVVASQARVRKASVMAFCKRHPPDRAQLNGGRPFRTTMPRVMRRRRRSGTLRPGRGRSLLAAGDGDYQALAGLVLE